MTITQTAQTDAASITADLDSIDMAFLAWEWTQAMTEQVEEDDRDTLSVEEAEYYGII